ncbi:Uncharacterized protein FKW44_013035, partial [Caligus rogercresseyi]
MRRYSFPSDCSVDYSIYRYHITAHKKLTFFSTVQYRIPRAVMRRRRQQKLEKKLQQFRSKDGGPDTGGTLKIYGEALCRDVPYKTLLLSISDSAAYVIEEMLEKYGIDRRSAPGYCLIQAASPTLSMETTLPRELYLDDEDCPLAILMNQPPSK